MNLRFTQIAQHVFTLMVLGGLIGGNLSILPTGILNIAVFSVLALTAINLIGTASFLVLSFLIFVFDKDFNSNDGLTSFYRLYNASFVFRLLSSALSISIVVVLVYFGSLWVAAAFAISNLLIWISIDLLMATIKEIWIDQGVTP